MEIIKTSIEDLVIIQPKVFEDERGYFMESYKESFIKENFPHIHFIQDNESRSTYGVLRGLHFQKAPFEQTKLVRVIKGEIFDVALDLRKSSSTYGKWESIVLSEDNKKQFLIPKGFAHGYLALKKDTQMIYLLSEKRFKKYERTIDIYDKKLNLKIKKKYIISQKDKKGISFDFFQKRIKSL